MKKLILSLATVALTVPAAAQQFIIVNGTPILTSNVEKITYEQDENFEQTTLPGALAADPKTTLFSEALRVTGLADSLRNYRDEDYECPTTKKYYYRALVWSEVAWFNEYRDHNFTIFAETDDVFAAKGINNLAQLKAHAKQVYDAVFPEDATISDPTDRRNSLNRFVAYHILKHGSPYWYLTALDKETGVSMRLCVDSTKTDMHAWYGTMMPEGSLKCTYPLTGDERGLYLNHRGLGSSPDKYGKQVRGAKIVPNDQPESEDDQFTHTCFNGYYFYIDDILTYDTEVLGTELWRVDFKTLSPDIMNNAADLRGNYLVDGSASLPDDSPNPKNGRNRVYKWDCIENIVGDTVPLSSQSPGLIARRAHCNFWSWQGDEIDIFGSFDMNIKLPPLPAGEWEVRMGVSALETRPAVRVSLNDEVMIDSLDCTKRYYGLDTPFMDLPKDISDAIFEYMSTNLLLATQIDDWCWLLTDVLTGEKLNVYWSPGPYDGDWFRGNTIREIRGEDPVTGVEVDWTERVQNLREYAKSIILVSLQPNMMSWPRECMHFNTGGGQSSFAGINELVRYVLGRIQSDGKSDNYLRLQWVRQYVLESWGLRSKDNTEMVFDFFELVPKAVFDNQEVPEE